jgi:hypothetical protein
MEEDKYYKPSKEEFITEFIKFNKGNPDKTFFLIKFQIDTEYTFFDEKVTWELMKSKWNSYLNSCKEEEKNPKYIKSMYSFMNDKEWNTDFKPNPKFSKKSSLIDKWTKQ